MVSSAPGEGPGRPRVVVGVDGSEASLRAVQFACEEARLCGGILHVVYAFASPSILGASVPDDYFGRLEAIARTELAASLAKVPAVGELGNVVKTVVGEPPGAALVAASTGARMLVVGSRGLGGFTGLLLGSVSSECIHHAACPVVILRDAGKAPD